MYPKFIASAVFHRLKAVKRQEAQIQIALAYTWDYFGLLRRRAYLKSTYLLRPMWASQLWVFQAGRAKYQTVTPQS